jgi:hypothetical protein
VLCEYGDARARPTVYTLGTDTGRMSCVRPNLQQLPRQGGVRACITADPGHLLISADFCRRGDPGDGRAQPGPQPDQDPGARAPTCTPWSPSRRSAPAFTKADRYTAKRGVFGWAYGGGVPSLARQVGVT